MLQSSVSCVSTPDAVDGFLSAISKLNIPQQIKRDMQFFAVLLIEASSALSERYGSLTSTEAIKSALAPDKRSHLNMVSEMAANSFNLAFDRLTGVGLTNPSAQLMQGVVAMHQRNEDDEVIQQWTNQALASMSSSELFILYEYLHRILTVLTSDSNALASYETNPPISEELREPKQTDLFARRINVDGGDESISGTNSNTAAKNKKSKKLLYKLG